jgi:hypothetical protein
VIRHQGDADTGRYLQPVAFEYHGLREKGAKFFGNLANMACHFRALAGQAGEQNNKFIASQAGHGVLLADAGLEASSDHFQDRVTDRVAERVVDVLEVVEVEKQQRTAQVVAFVQRRLLGQAIHQQVRLGRLVSGS